MKSFNSVAGVDVDTYVERIRNIPIPSQQRVLELARRLASARQAYRRTVFQSNFVLKRCLKFLQGMIARHFRWDYAFEVSQKQVERIDQIRDLISEVSFELQSFIEHSDADLSHDSRSQPMFDTGPAILVCLPLANVVSRLEQLSIRTHHLRAWHMQLKSNVIALRHSPSNTEIQSNEYSVIASADKKFATYIRLKESLASTGLRLVVKIAHQYDTRQHSMMDLIQDGNVGLMVAAEKFDPSRELAFSTYATHWIRQKIGLGIQKREMIHIPVAKLAKISLAEKKLRNLAQQKQRLPNPEDESRIVATLKFDERILHNFRKRVRSVEALRNEDFARSFDLEDKQNETPAESWQNETLRKALGKALEKLDERQRMILNLKFGLEGQTYSRRSIGHLIGLTYQRIQQLEVESLKILRDELQELK